MKYSNKTNSCSLLFMHLIQEHDVCHLLLPLTASANVDQGDKLLLIILLVLTVYTRLLFLSSHNSVNN